MDIFQGGRGGNLGSEIYLAVARYISNRQIVDIRCCERRPPICSSPSHKTPFCSRPKIKKTAEAVSLICGQKEWLSELRKYSDSIKISILDLGVLVK